MGGTPLVVEPLPGLKYEAVMGGLTTLNIIIHQDL